VLEVQVPAGLAYLQYLGRHSDYGDAVSVSPTVMQTRPAITKTLFDGDYATFYPAHAAVAQGLVTAVGHIDGASMPKAWRRAGMRSPRGVESWILEDASGETPLRELSEEEQRLPIVAVWNHNYLIARILEGWRPEKAGRRG
jgi:hypothetical protein